MPLWGQREKKPKVGVFSLGVWSILSFVRAVIRWPNMRIEIDQSGPKKMDKHGYTVLAFSNKRSAAVLFTAAAKKTCREYLEKQARNHVKKQRYYLELFVTGIVLLIRDYLHEIQTIVIDNEWDGQEKNIKASLLRHLRRLGSRLTDADISFGISDHSPAHKKAYAVHRFIHTGRGAMKPDRTVTVAEWMVVLKK